MSEPAAELDEVVEAEVVGVTDADEPAPEPAPLTHDEIVAACEERLVGEGQPPFTAKLLANVYADSFELRKLLDGLAAMGGVDGVIGGVFGKLLAGGKRKRKGSTDDG